MSYRTISSQCEMPIGSLFAGRQCQGCDVNSLFLNPRVPSDERQEICLIFIKIGKALETGKRKKQVEGCPLAYGWGILRIVSRRSSWKQEKEKIAIDSYHRQLILEPYNNEAKEMEEMAILHIILNSKPNLTQYERDIIDRALIGETPKQIAKGLSRTYPAIRQALVSIRGKLRPLLSGWRSPRQ